MLANQVVSSGTTSCNASCALRNEEVTMTRLDVDETTARMLMAVGKLDAGDYHLVREGLLPLDDKLLEGTKRGRVFPPFSVSR